ncbi:hypothetical protein CB0940_01035 [Cercospora beticola]|uniref:Uncharacterized protein n=2 Tax=Cercospora beticola TaxID=122368 RepID=A0A2G5ICN0_CERBT|nr:hypothetical protein CB0940_01035 [Cercospora beticola]PIB02626.1 hypothetical protein CB0940_01035 [Cercospora beticola]
MRFFAWLQSLRGKDHEDPRHSHSPYQRADRSSTFSSTLDRNHRASAVRSPDAESSRPKDSRRSRGLSMSRTRSIYNNRRSWFGGRPDTDEQVPEMPKTVRAGQAKDIPLSVLPSSPAEQATGQPRAAKRQSSRFTQNERGPVAPLPALPSMPVTVDRSAQPATSTLPAEKRRSRHASTSTLRRQPSISSIKSRRSRSSFWVSSNPDDSDSDIPPVPPLCRGESSESVRRDDSEDDVRLSRRLTRNNTEPAKSRPVSVVSTMSRKSYVPRSAAKGFLNSTNGASDESRKSFRKSFNMEDDSAMVCLTEEQRIEWAKLMNGDMKLAEATRTSTPEMDKGDNNPPRRPSYANSQALAALEFGIR